MKKYIVYSSFFLMAILLFISCTKIQNGFLSPTMQYSPALLIIPKGQIVKSNGIIPDGSSLPLNVKWVHVYDSTGKNVDDMFSKSYSIDVWKQLYDPTTDKTFAAIMAKRGKQDMQPINVSPTSGVIESNSAAFNIPSGTYTMDMEVSNKVGTQLLKKAMTLIFQDTPPMDVTSSAVGIPGNGIALAGTAPVTYKFPNGAVNDPYLNISFKRISDSPNVIYLKFTDRNGIPFNPKAGEVIKRPATGLNPDPPYLQNLEYYAPDTYEESDTAMSVEFPLTPYPIASLGNSYLMYYNLQSAHVIIDSTSAWTSNPDNIKYKGTSDSHYLGTYELGRYDYSVKVGIRVFVPGTYEVTCQMLDVTHR
jgi:hypothetical protein